MNNSFSIQFSNVLTSSGVFLEQAPWNGTGVVTKLDLVKAIYNSVYDSTESPDKNCGLQGSAYASTLYVYPYDRNLLFQIGLTWGELGEGVFSEVEVTENIEFSLSDTGTSTYPIQELISYKFLNLPWDSFGNEVSGVVVSVKGEDITLTKSVYGTVQLVYKTVRYSYSLLILPREDTVDTAFQSVSYVWWNGGVEMKVLEPPSGAEYDNKMDAKCWERSQLRVNPDPDLPVLPSGESNSETVFVDYCSQEVVN